MSNSLDYSESNNQKRDCWLNDSGGGYDGLDEECNYTTVVISGDSPRTEQMELNFSNEEDKMVDPLGDVSNWERQYPSYEFECTTLSDSSFSNFLSSDAEDHDHKDHNTSSEQSSDSGIPGYQSWMMRSKYIENNASNDLLGFQNNVRPCPHQGAVLQQMQMVDEKNDEFNSNIWIPITELHENEMSECQTTASETLSNCSETINVSPEWSVDGNKCDIGGPWNCKISFRPFINKSLADNHSNTQSNCEELQKTQKFHAKCKPCKKIFFNLQEFNSHMSLHGGKDVFPSYPICANRSETQASDPYECNFCRFKKPLLLHIHHVANHWEKKFRCLKCGIHFTQKSALATHMQSHNPSTRRPFRCEGCGKCFTRKGILEVHVKTVHLNLKDVQCLECDKKFSEKGSMMRHIKVVHLGIRQPCSYCHKTFATNSNAKRHENQVHLKTGCVSQRLD